MADQSVEFAIPKFEERGSGLTVIVGPNNSGKSTIIRAVRALLSRDETFVAGRDDRRVGLSPRLMLSAEEGAEQISVAVEERADAAHLKKIGNYRSGADKLRYIPSRRPWNDRFNAGSGMDARSHEQNLHLNLRSSEHYVDAQFGSAIKEIDIDPDKRNQFSNLLKLIEPTLTEWSIDNDGNQDFISFLTVSGGSHRAGLLGDGVANLFRIIYSIFSLEKGDVLLLDEPELSLHPQCQRNLHEIISEKSSENQIVLSTHSPYFVSWRDIKNGCRVFRTNLREVTGAEIGSISGPTLSKVISIANSDIKNRKLYDVVAKEIFFSRGCLFVEGQEDAHLISQYREDEKMPYVEVFGYGAGGASNILSWIEMALDIGVRSVALFDRDEKGFAAYEAAREKHGQNANVLLRLLPTKDIRDKYKLDCDCKKETSELDKEGIFTRDWKMKVDHKEWFDRFLIDSADFLHGTCFKPPSSSPSA